MKVSIFKGIAVFFILLVATSIMMDSAQMDFGTVNFFDRHGVFFLVFITFFPRLTLLFSSVVSGGILWWLGFFFCPRILVASLATMAYFHTNPVLVTISWVLALSGEVLEKKGLAGKNRFVFRTFHAGPHFGQEGHPFSSTVKSGSTLKNDDAIEAEFTKDP